MTPSISLVAVCCSNDSLSSLKRRTQFYDFLHRLIDAGFENRIMFGSDEMVWPDAVSAAIDTIQNDPALTSGQKRDILYNNAARFLRLKR